jgi:hypothetical protein
MPHVEIIAILVKQEDVTNMWLRDAHDQLLSSYQPLDLEDKYLFPKLKCHMTSQWLNDAKE